MAVIAFYLLIKVNQSITSPNNYNASLNECLNLHWLIAKEKNVVLLCSSIYHFN